MWSCGAFARLRCAGAAALLSGARAVCTAATGFAGVTALAIAELSTTGAFAARVIRLLRRGLLLRGTMVPKAMRDGDAWVQRVESHRLLLLFCPIVYFSTACTYI